MLSLAVVLALAVGAEASGCWFWITPIGKGAQPFPKYMDCTGLASYKDCGKVECTDEGYPKSGCSEITEKEYNCLLAKEEPGHYRYLAAEDPSCTGLPPPVEAAIEEPMGPSPDGSMPKMDGDAEMAIEAPGTAPTDNAASANGAGDNGPEAVGPSPSSTDEDMGMSGGYGRRRFRKFRKVRKN